MMKAIQKMKSKEMYDINLLDDLRLIVETIK
jgi:hypothetical protein